MKARGITAAAVLACAALISFIPPDVLSVWVSRPVMTALNSLTARAPFPVLEVAMPLLLSLIPLAIIRAGIACVKQRSASPLLKLSLSGAIALSSVLMLYALIWLPMTRTARFDDTGGYAARDLVALCDRLTAQASALGDYSSDDAAYDRDAIPEKAAALRGDGAAVKVARYPEWMRALNIAGICFPLTGEAIINPTEPILTLPFAACHEAAHQLGYGREDEANYVAYRACMGGDRYFRYSGTMYALYYAMEALLAEDYPAWQRATRQMSRRVRDDFYKMDGFHSAEPTDGLLKTNRISDAFLRLGGQDGLKSYGHMVNLLIENPRE